MTSEIPYGANLPDLLPTSMHLFESYIESAILVFVQQGLWIEILN